MFEEIEERGPDCSYRELFIEPIWSREWIHAKGDILFRIEDLAGARAYPGLGLDDPFQIRVDENSIKLLTLGQGKTLSQHLEEKGGRLAAEEAFQIIGGVVQGLIRLREGLGLSHGQVHPDNIRVGLNGESSIVSTPLSRFGLKNRWHTQLLPQPSNCYQSRDLVGESGDLYSLGLLLYRMLRGQESFMQLVAQEAELSDDLLKSLPIHASALIAECVSGRAGLSLLAESLVHEDVELPQSGRANELIEQGADKFQRGLFGAARKIWCEAAEKDPGSVAAWNNIAVTTLARGEWEPAIYELEKAYHCTSSHPVLDLNIGTCLLHMGDLKSAGVWLNRAREMNPWLCTVYHLLSELCLQKGDFAKAQRWAGAGVSLNPKSRENRGQMARVLQAQYKYAEAKLQAELLRLIPLRVPLWDNLITEQSEPPWGRIRVDRDEEDGEDGLPKTTSPFPPKPLTRTVYEIPSRKH